MINNAIVLNKIINANFEKKFLISENTNFDDLIFYMPAFDLEVKMEKEDDIFYKQNPIKAVELYKKLAVNYDSIAQNNLAFCLYEGVYIKKDLNLAIDLWRDSAKKGNILAKLNLGNCFYNGEGVEQNYDKALLLYLEALKANNYTALYNIGICLKTGHGILQDNKKSFLCFYIAEQFVKNEQLLQSIKNNIGCCYFNGEGIEQNYQKSYKYFCEADQNKFAQNNIACCYYFGIGVEQNKQLALEYFQKSVKNNCIIALYNISLYYLINFNKNDNNSNLIYSNLLRAANYNEPFSLYFLFKIENDAQKANMYYEQSFNILKDKCKYDTCSKSLLALFYFNSIELRKILKNNIKFKSELKKNKFLLKLEKINAELSNKSLDEKNIVDFNLADDLNCGLKLLENNNNIHAKYNLALCYYKGFAVEKNLNLAYYLFNEVAKYKFGNALCLLGNKYFFDKQYDKAFKYYNQAKTFNENSIYNNLAECYFFGLGVEQDKEKAFNYYTIAVNEDDKNSMYSLAYCYQYGINCEVDYKKAFNLFLKSANLEVISAQTAVGYCYLYGLGVEKNYKNSVKWFLDAAIMGDELAQNYIGECYYFGFGVNKDLKKAFKWFKKASEGGYKKALNSIGYCYYYGFGIVKDYKKAFNFFELAANAGDVDGQRSLGICYFYGMGVEKNLKKAFDCFNKSASKNDKYSQNFLKRYKINKKLI